MASSALLSLLSDIRQHPAFNELLASVPAPAVPRFKVSQAQEVEKARASWIYRSGQADQHEAWLVFLSGRSVNMLTTKEE